jgi:hypothetical protein
VKRRIEETENEFILIEESLDEVSIKRFSKDTAERELVKSVTRIKGKEKPPTPNIHLSKKDYYTNLLITKINDERIIIENILGEFKEK